MRNIGLLILGLFVLGCNIYKPGHRDAAPSNFPSAYSMYSEKKVSGKSKWWLEFNSTELNSLIDSVLQGNFDLKEAHARLKQVQAVYKKSRSGLFPYVSGSAGYQYNKTENRDTNTGSGTDTFSIGLAASYEVDLWGRVRSVKEAARSSLEAGIEDYHTAAMTITAKVTETWIDIITTRQEIRYLKERIRINEAQLSLLELRFENALASAMDVLHQRESLAGIKAQLPALEARERIYENELALLIGKAAGGPVIVKQDTIPDVPPAPETGIPADLLAMRPDIRAAGLRLKAADWEISAAKADRLPALSLTASGTFSSPAAEDVFRNWIINLAANLTGPIFDAGKRKAEVDRVKAVAEERIAIYEKTVLTAVKEVENNLVSEDRQRSLLGALETQADASRLSLREATRRYRTGQDTYMNMEEKLLNVQNIEAELIRQKAALVKYRVALYRALGGNWSALPENRN